jgi:hypothetical protein
MPRLGDEVPPWEYRGWLLVQIQMGHYHPEACNRWDYYMRTREAGRLLDEPIPQITFSRRNPAAAKNLMDCLEIPLYRLACVRDRHNGRAEPYGCRRTGNTLPNVQLRADAATPLGLFGGDVRRIEGQRETQ